ncbi:MAG TPA: hypothetical protein VFO94_15610 [Gammaproteobacteria bacterium]|nr:hypothetical protein [Gammaproteobacteria bacterium]
MRAYLTILALGALCGCSSSEVIVAHQVELAEPASPPDEATLLDVGIVVFDPGVPKGEIDKETLEKLIAQGVYVQIRRAESIQMAVELRDTLQKSAQWGSVWVTPKSSAAADVTVTAKILESNGYVARVAVDAYDASGREWLKKSYEVETAAAAYNRGRYGDVDAYGDLYNSIANDLGAVRAALPEEQARALRTVAALRYAGELSPSAFEGYVARRDGAYVPLRLPARDDPLFDRTQRVRQRERLFFETLDEYYEKLAVDAQAAYDGWRENSREVSLAIHDAQRGARWRTALGIASLVGSLAYGGGGSPLVGQTMLLVGNELLKMRQESIREKQLYTAELTELSQTFDGEIAPLVIELAGVEHRLTGSAEAQYAEWAELLQQQFLEETAPVALSAEPPPSSADTVPPR